MRDNLKMKVLFLCTHNSARSQLAEGLLNYFHGNDFEGMSAGTQPGKVNPLAIKALSEIGIDISKHYSKHAKEFLGKEIDVAVTVCDNAKEECPFFPGAKKIIHHSFKDPSAGNGTEQEKIEAFRKTRDEIKEWLGKETVNWKR